MFKHLLILAGTLPCALAFAQTPNNDAMAALDAQDLVAVPGGVSVPSTIPVKETNYPVPDGAIFVAPDGKADNRGTSQAPMTLKQAVEKSPAGSTIVLRGGTYRDIHRLTLRRKLTLQAAPNEKPVVKGSIIVSGWVQDGNAWRKDNWTYKFGAPDRVGPDYLDPKYPIAIERDMAFLNDRPLAQVATRGEVGPGKFFVDGANKQMFIGDDPTNKTLEATIYDQGITIGRTSGGDGSIVRGLGLYHYADQGFSGGAANMTLENNTFAWNAQRGAYIYQGSDDLMLRGNVFSCNGRVGLRASSGKRMRVEGNTFSWNNVERFRTAWDAAGLKITNLDFAPADGPVFRDNLIERNLCTGLWLDINANHATIVRNTARFNQGIGLFFEISQDAIIAFNVAQGNGTGVMISNSRDARIYNNTLIANGTNVVVKQTNRTNGGNGLDSQKGQVVAGTQPGEVFQTTNTILRNNIFSNAREGSKNPLLNASSNKAESSKMLTSSDFNAFYRNDATTPPEVAKWTSGGKDIGFQTLQDYAAATHLDKNSLNLSGAANPFFVDEARGDFRLKAGSPALGRGEKLPEDIAQAAGVDANALVHLGALGAS